MNTQQETRRNREILWSGTVAVDAPRTLGAEPINVDAAAWSAYLTSLRDSVQLSWTQAREAYFTLKKVRESLGLPFKASPTGEGSPAYGMSPEAAWSDSLDQNAVDIQAMAKLCVDAANDAIAGKRKLIWDPKLGEFVISALPEDVLSLKRSEQGVPLLYDAKNGAQAHVKGTVGLPQILIAVAVGATVVQGLTIYFGVKKLCETLENVSSDKTIRTVMETQVEMIKAGATPAEAQAATKAVFDGAAAVAKAKGEAAASKPPDPLADALKTVAYVGLGALVIYAVIRLVPPIERAPRAATALPNPRIWGHVPDTGYPFDHTVKPLKSGRHPKYKHLVMFEIEPHYGSYVLTAVGHKGDALISEDDARHMFGEQLDNEFAYLTDEYLQLLERRKLLSNPSRQDVVRAIESEAAKEGLRAFATPTTGSWTNVHVEERVYGEAIGLGVITVYESGKVTTQNGAGDARFKRVADRIKARFGTVRSAA